MTHLLLLLSSALLPLLHQSGLLDQSMTTELTPEFKRPMVITQSNKPTQETHTNQLSSKLTQALIHLTLMKNLSKPTVTSSTPEILVPDLSTRNTRERSQSNSPLEVMTFS